VRKIEGERLRSLEGEGSKEFRSADCADYTDKELKNVIV